MDEEKLQFYLNSLQSEEIKDADSIENNAIDFRNQFVEFQYQEIQIKFDIYFEIIQKISLHYRPKVQSSGCDCLYIILKEAAPSQILRNKEQFQKIFDKLIQVGHSDVMPSLLPALTEKLDLIYKNPENLQFSELFYHLLETWNRDSITNAANYIFIIELPKIINFLGFCLSKYIKLIIQIIVNKIKYLKSKNHLLQYSILIKEICLNCWIIIKDLENEINIIINLLEENSENFEQILIEINKIKEILNNSPKLPIIE